MKITSQYSIMVENHIKAYKLHIGNEVIKIYESINSNIKLIEDETIELGLNHLSKFYMYNNEIYYSKSGSRPLYGKTYENIDIVVYKNFSGEKIMRIHYRGNFFASLWSFYLNKYGKFILEYVQIGHHSYLETYFGNKFMKQKIEKLK